MWKRLKDEQPVENQEIMVMWGNSHSADRYTYDPGDEFFKDQMENTNFFWLEVPRNIDYEIKVEEARILQVIRDNHSNVSFRDRLFGADGKEVMNLSEIIGLYMERGDI